MKKMILILILAMSVWMLSACAKGNAQNGSGEQSEILVEYGDSLGQQMLKAFDESVLGSASEIAAALCEVAPDYSLMTMDVSTGYLDGFNADITGFTTGTKFSPMIGSIPFVGYVFETEDAEALLAELQAAADPAWNICTEADETVYSIKGNLVFFLMCPNEG